MSQKILNIAILFGGKSAEHEISLKSAKNVIDALDRTLFNPILIGISKEGKWYYDSSNHVMKEDADGTLSINSDCWHVGLPPASRGQLINFSSNELLPHVDVVFPVIHGPMAEDGTLQGLLKLADVPFVGAGVLGAAVGMDKEVMKRLLVEAGLPIGKYLTLRSHQARPTFKAVVDELGLPCFVKPANLGSSVGINRVDNESQFETALDEAFSFDNKIIIEEFIEGREIECAILGNENPKASIPGEISFSHNFYSYEAKYEDDKGYKIEIPAQLDDAVLKEVQKIGVQTFEVLECAGFGRVDVFVTKDNRILVNEINTIPGFTQVSMYPKLWEKSGLAYSELITQLIQLAFDRYNTEKNLKTTK